MTLKEQYENIVQEYINKFCEKQDTDFEYWVGGYVGEVCEIADAFLNFNDIKFDIDNNIPKGEIFDWYWQCVENNEFEINYKSYTKDARQ